MVGMSWMMVAIVLVVLGVLGTTIYGLFRRREAGASVGDEGSSRPYSVVLARFWAWMALLVVGIGGVLDALGDLVSDRVALTLNVMQFWPTPLPGFEAEPQQATAVDPFMDVVHLQAEGLKAGTRWFLAGGDLLMAMVAAAVIFLVLRMCNGILRETPFTAQLRRAAWFTALFVLVGGCTSQALTLVGRARAGGEVLDYSGFSYTNPAVNQALGGEDDGPNPHLDWPYPVAGGTIEFPFTPLWVAIIIIVVVELLNAGVRLSAKNARLAKDVEGLV
ncbi:hypothetical protein [Galactobacter valiniphilus]|uniref:hypothetical protein n=1 Tax=Galactobacter valiniphilus TaxID=2676122 RepID=UPI003735E04A